jgi:hypothetical protein
MSLYLSIYQCVYLCLPIYLSIYLCLPTYLPICLCLPNCLPIYVCMYISISICVYLPTYLSILTVYLSICLSIYLSVYPSMDLSSICTYTIHFYLCAFKKYPGTPVSQNLNVLSSHLVGLGRKTNWLLGRCLHTKHENRQFAIVCQCRSASGRMCWANRPSYFYRLNCTTKYLTS